MTKNRINLRMEKEKCVHNRDGACVNPRRQREITAKSGTVIRLSSPCRFCCGEWRGRNEA